jgi:hypothetical protein
MLKVHSSLGLALVTLLAAVCVNGQAPASTPEIPTGLLLVDAATYQSIPLASTPLMGELPPAADLSGFFPAPGNQGNQASCVGWAVAYALKSAQEAQERNWRPDAADRTYSPAFIYNQIKTVNTCKGGTSFIAALNLLRRDGVANLADFPYSENDCSRVPSAAIRQNAKPFRIADWRRVNVQDETEIKNNIVAGFPVLIGMIVDQAFFNLRGDTPYTQFSGVNLGAHAVVVIGYDDSKSAFKIINSWGTTWGTGGYGWISYTALQQAVREGYVAQDIVVNHPPIPAPPAPSPGPSPAPVPPANPVVALDVPQIQHNINLPNNLAPPFNLGMNIRATGTVTNASGKTLQIVVRFAYQNGPSLLANFQERNFRDVQGLVATGTQPIPVTTQNLNLANFPMTIPYYALNLQPSSGQVNYNLVLSLSVYLDNYIVAQSPAAPFGLRW